MLSNFDIFQVIYEHCATKGFDEVAQESQYTFCKKLWTSASKRSMLTKEDRQTSLPLQNKTTTITEET